MSTATTGAAAPRVRVVLPDGWYAVPLRPETSRRRAVSALVDAVVTGDEAALLRARLRDSLGASAQDAAAAGAQQLVLSLMRTPQGLPLPASLVVTVLDVGSPRVAASADLGQRPGDDLLSTVVQAGHVVRRVSERVTDSDLGGGETRTLAVDYWLRPAGTRHVGVLAFSTPLVALREAVLPLFDAVVASARWLP